MRHTKRQRSSERGQSYPMMLRSAASPGSWGWPVDMLHAVPRAAACQPAPFSNAASPGRRRFLFPAVQAWEGNGGWRAAIKKRETRGLALFLNFRNADLT